MMYPSSIVVLTYTVRPSARTAPVIGSRSRERDVASVEGIVCGAIGMEV